MRQMMLPAAEAFVADLRALFADADLTEQDRWAKARESLAALLADETLKAHAADWPDTEQEDGGPGNLLFYEDPDYGFVINALIKGPHAETVIHDHGRSWTLYGVLEGGERVARFTAKDVAPGETPNRAEIEPDGETQVGPGYIDLVAPWKAHAEYNGPQRTVAVIVRSEKSGGFVQNCFEPETGNVGQYYGPTQIPYRLA